MEQSHPGAIPGDEASSIGVRFEGMPNGEIHVSEILPGTPASNALNPPQLGDQLFRVNGKLLPALIDKYKLTLLLAQQCFKSDTVSLSFRTESLDEYTSVVHLAGSPSTRRGPGTPDRSKGKGEIARSPSKSPDQRNSGPLNQARSLQAAYLPVGLSTSDPRWSHFSKSHELNSEFDDLPNASSLSDFLNEMRLELSRVRALAQQKVDDAEKRRAEAEEDMEVLQEQTFKRVQLMQEQITALRTENQSLRAEVQQLNRTVRTRNMPVCPSCSRLNMQAMQEGAAAAIDKARTLLQQDIISSHPDMDASPPRLPILPTHTHSSADKVLRPTTQAESDSGAGRRGNSRQGDGRLGNDALAGLQLLSAVGMGSKDGKDGEVEMMERQGLKGALRGSDPWRRDGKGEKASVVMEDGSELSVDPRTGRVLTGGSGGLELL